MIKLIILATFLSVVLPIHRAIAQQGVLRGLSGAERVVVWKNSEAHSEGLKLIQAGIHNSNPALLSSLIACIVPTGTTIIFTSVGFATHDIMVTSGSSSGCHGNVPMEATR